METEANLHLQRFYTFDSANNKINATKTMSNLGGRYCSTTPSSADDVFLGGNIFVTQ